MLIAPAVTDLHHEVLTAWAELRRGLAAPPPVLSLDFHTDTLDPVRRGIPPAEWGAWQMPGAVAHAVEILHHDEHFVWALQSGILSRALIVALSPQNGPCGHPALQVRHFAAQPDLPQILNEPENVRSFADSLLETGIPDAVADAFAGLREPWILDVDCDVLLTAAAPDFPENGRFADLVRRAALVTISRESDWVRLLRLPGETVTGEMLAEKLREKCRNIRLAKTAD